MTVARGATDQALDHQAPGRSVGDLGAATTPGCWSSRWGQIPIANEAVDGPLAMLSPSNTWQGLTESEELYPSGVGVSVPSSHRDESVAPTLRPRPRR